VGPFYPPKTKAGDFLTHYATELRTVEIDATWHAMPARRTVEGWSRKAPEHFRFSFKVPKIITHEKVLVDCRDEWNQFLDALEPLRNRLGAVLLQFPYFSQKRDPAEWAEGRDFLGRLEHFLEMKPDDLRLVVEVRNRSWIAPQLLDLLRSKKTALALVEFPNMPSGPELLDRCDPVTGDFCYVRFLGNHREMDLLVAEARESGSRQGDWDSLLVDRARETKAWMPSLRQLVERNLEVFVYFNNHYAGFAPGSIEQFLDLWES
jgi:uncharacterized protein YecE (DUF72 family)